MFQFLRFFSIVMIFLATIAIIVVIIGVLAQISRQAAKTFSTQLSPENFSFFPANCPFVMRTITLTYIRPGPLFLPVRKTQTQNRRPTGGSFSMEGAESVEIRCPAALHNKTGVAKELRRRIHH